MCCCNFANHAYVQLQGTPTYTPRAIFFDLCGALGGEPARLALPQANFLIDAFCKTCVQLHSFASDQGSTLLGSTASQNLQKCPSQHGKGQWKSSAALGSLSALLQSSCCLSQSMSLKVYSTRTWDIPATSRLPVVPQAGCFCLLAAHTNLSATKGCIMVISNTNAGPVVCY